MNKHQEKLDKHDDEIYYLNSKVQAFKSQKNNPIELLNSIGEIIK